MGKKNASNWTDSKLSAAISLTDSSYPQNIKGTSVLHCAYLPPQYFQPLFASVYHGIGSQHVRVHDIHSKRVLCDHSTSSTTSITCLEWGRHRSNNREEHSEPFRKKRKIYTSLDHPKAQEDEVVVAYGTNESKIYLLSPAEGRVVATLEGAHTFGIKDFKFSPADDCQTGWSLGGDGNLVQWNLQKVVNIRTIPITGTFATTLLPTRTHMLYASYAVHGFDLGDSEQKLEFGASTTSVHTMILSATGASAESPKLLTAANSNPQMQLFDISSGEILVTLVAQNHIKSLSYLPATHVIDDNHSRRQADLLAAVTTDDTVELFIDPFKCTTSLQTKRQPNTSMQNRSQTTKSSAIIQLYKGTRTRASMPILKVCFRGNILSIAWTEGANVYFEEIQCIDGNSGEVLLSGSVSRRVLGSGILASREKNSMHKLQDEKNINVDESHAIVLHGGQAEHYQQSDHRAEVIDISSAMEDTDSSDGAMRTVQPFLQPQSNGPYDASIGPKIKTLGADENVDDHKALSFGERIAVNVPETVEVTAVSQNENKSLIPIIDQNPEPTANLTFTALLPQALGTSDSALLERCLHVGDTNMIRATVERLNPAFATALLEKLADRLHTRPGRTGTLLVWVQWTLIAHGGYLGTQTAIVKKLGALHRVVRERATTLQPLLSLKGKLDMLEAQMNMRKSLQQRLGNRMTEGQSNEPIYVEGQNEISSDDDAAHGNPASDEEILDIGGFASVDRINSIPRAEQASDEFKSEDQDSEESEIDESDHLFDQEASESGQNTSESLDEDVDYNDIDSFDAEERSEVEEPPKKGKFKLGFVNGIGSRRA